MNYSIIDKETKEPISKDSYEIDIKNKTLIISIFFDHKHGIIADFSKMGDGWDITCYSNVHIICNNNCKIDCLYRCSFDIGNNCTINMLDLFNPKFSINLIQYGSNCILNGHDNNNNNNIYVYNLNDKFETLLKLVKL